MIKKFGLFLIAVNLWATPPCEYDQVNVCLYMYTTGLSAEMNIANTTNKKVFIKMAEGTLDGYHRKIENFILQPSQHITLLKSQYKVPNQKPIIGKNSIDYKFID